MNFVLLIGIGVLQSDPRPVEPIRNSLREVLASVFEAGLLRGQMEQTEITRRLAAWAAILAVPTAVAGIYGMNFEYMPELKWEVRILCRGRRDRSGLHCALCFFPAIALAMRIGAPAKARKPRQ